MAPPLKLTDEHVELVRSMLKNHRSLRYIGSQLHVDKNTVHDFCRREAALWTSREEPDEDLL